LRYPEINDANTCYDITPNPEVLRGIRNSDLHIFVNGNYDVAGDDNTYFAFGAACVVTPRPVFGYLEINLAQLWSLDLADEATFKLILA